MKLEVVEPLFEEGADHRLMDVEEGLVLNFAVLDESDDAGSLADKQAVVVAWGQRDTDRVHEAASDLD